MCTIKHVVIAAAGIGSRMGKDIPKCQIEFLGKPLLHHLLSNLKDIEDIRIVIGYKALEVIKLAHQVRKDITFVYNSSYKNTTTLHSYYIGSLYLKSGALYIDADIYFNPNSFSEFLHKASNNLNIPMIGITKAKTEDCVYVELNHKQIVSFSRSVKQPWEWANIAYLPNGFLKNKAQISVYKELEQSLPLQSQIIESYEMDTVKDMEKALTLMNYT